MLPLVVNIEGQPAVVIGGGKIACRKIRKLLSAGAVITVVSPRLCSDVQNMVDEKLLKWKRKRFSPEDLKGAWIVIAATDDADTNRQVAQAAEPRQLVNVARPSKAGNVHFPALLQRGKLTVAVSTSGTSPGLAAHIRDELAAVLDDAYAGYLEFLSKCREWIENNVAAEKDRQRLLARLLDPKYKTSPKERENFVSELKNGVDK